MFLSIVVVGALASAAVFAGFRGLEPYMDEIFHIPQAQTICSGDFQTWDPKITTFPGMYYLSYVVQRVIDAVPGINNFPCSPTTLRVLNVVLSAFIPALAYLIRTRLTTASNTKVDYVLASLKTYLYPFSFLYYFLYYTDTCSVFFFLFAYWIGLRMIQDDRCHSSRSQTKSKESDCSTASLTTASPSLVNYIMLLLVSTLCILMRQTNAVWIMFLAGILMLEELILLGKFKDETYSVYSLWSFVGALWSEKVHLLAISMPCLVPVVGFAVFVVKNGGIVLGDKENHQPTLHPVMVFYPFAIYGLHIMPRLFVEIVSHVLGGNKIKFSWVTTFWFSVLLVVAASAMMFGSQGHPFLLADNRHYSFYLWNRILKHDHLRRWVSPLFGCMVSVGIEDLSRSKGFVWMAIFAVALILTLIPTPLLEFRYFTQGVIIAILNAPSTIISNYKGTQHYLGWIVYTIEEIVLLVLNFMVVFIFLQKPFTAVDGSVGRFMY